jgi:hypothetical protein
MKLSKAQQEVVDKMRPGWELRLLENGKAYLAGPNNQRINVCWGTFNSMRLNKVIVRKAEFINGWVYQLTEKYKQ